MLRAPPPDPRAHNGLEEAGSACPKAKNRQVARPTAEPPARGETASATEPRTPMRDTHRPEGRGIPIVMPSSERALRREGPECPSPVVRKLPELRLTLHRTRRVDGSHIVCWIPAGSPQETREAGKTGKQEEQPRLEQAGGGHTLRARTGLRRATSRAWVPLSPTPGETLQLCKGRLSGTGPRALTGALTGVLWRGL